MKQHQTFQRYSYVLIIASLLFLWELLGHNKLIGNGAFPALSDTIKTIIDEAVFFKKHLLSTLLPASIGFIVGSLIAIVVAVASAWNKNIERALNGVNITIYCIPPIVLGPLLAIATEGIYPQIILSALLVYFPVMLTFLVGMKESDPRPQEVIRAYGGSRFDELRYVCLRSGLSSLLTGLQIAVPAAILGSMLAEFGSGSRWGLGSYLLGAMGSGDPAKIWAIALVSTFTAAIGYIILGMIIHSVRKSSQQVTIAAANPAAVTTVKNFKQRILWGLSAFLLPFIIWYACIKFSGVSDFMGKTPFDVFLYLVHSSTDNWMELFDALQESIPSALFGLILGLLFALMLAVASLFWKTLERIILPISILFQAMPIVALVPIVLVLFGHGYIGTVSIAVLITFFPAFVVIGQGLRSTPQAILDVSHVYAASKWDQLIRLRIPYAMPYLCSAAKLAIPQALLGVISAEWLATSLGVGNILINAQSMMNYNQLWSISFLVVLSSVCLYLLVQWVERKMLSRYSTSVD